MTGFSKGARGASVKSGLILITLATFNFKRKTTMSLDNVTPGDNVPDAFNVIIEIPMNADPVKYEVDKATGAIFVDRFMSTSMHYPTNYGYVPRTISGDGDPVWLFRAVRSAF